MRSSIRCATTSASVSEVKVWPRGGELLAQLLVVLDDAVEDDRDAAACSRRAGGRCPQTACRASPSACGRGPRRPAGSRLRRRPSGVEVADAPARSPDRRPPSGRGRPSRSRGTRAAEPLEDDGLAGSCAPRSRRCRTCYLASRAGRANQGTRSSRFVPGVTAGVCRLDDDRAGPGGTRRRLR